MKNCFCRRAIFGVDSSIRTSWRFTGQPSQFHSSASPSATKFIADIALPRCAGPYMTRRSCLGLILLRTASQPSSRGILYRRCKYHHVVQLLIVSFLASISCVLRYCTKRSKMLESASAFLHASCTRSAQRRWRTFLIGHSLYYN